VWDLFKATPDEWQAEGLREWADPNARVKRIAMQACAGPGKSTLLSWCGWNGLLCYADKGKHPKGAAVSITRENLDTGLWAELAKWRQRSPMLNAAFEQTGSDIFSRSHPETWRLSARSFPKTADTEQMGKTLAGLHSEFIFYLIDESGGLNAAIGRAADQGLSNCEWGRIIQAGNPLSHDSLLYVSVTKLRHQHYVIAISGDPEDPNRSKRIDVEWAADQIKTYGRENPWVMVYILGKFPPSSMNSLIGIDDLEAAKKRQPAQSDYIWQPKILGGDLARFGDDKTALVVRQGLFCSKFTKLRNAKTQDIGGRIIRAKSEETIAAVFLDAAMAGGVQDYCELLGHTITLVEFAGKADDPMFANKRAEMMWTAANYIKGGAMVPDDPEFIAGACAHTYTFNKNGQIIIEPKELVKKKLGYSPDEWDAYICTFAHPVAVEESIENYLRYPGMQQGGGNVGHAVTDRPEE
jgi:phage terminase large subunit